MLDSQQFKAQLSGLMYKNRKRHHRSCLITMLEIGLTITFFVNAKRFAMYDTTATPLNNLQSVIRPQSFFMPNSKYVVDLYEKGRGLTMDLTNATLAASLSQLEQSYSLWKKWNFWKQEKHVIMFEQAESSADKVPAKLDFKVVLFEPVPAFKTLNLSFDYTEAGLTSAQLLVTKMFLNYWKQEKQLVFSSNVSVKTRRLPDKVMDVYEMYLIYLPAVFVVFTVMSTVVIVEEKTSTIHDALKNAGVSQTVYWISWILYRMIVGLLSSGVAIVYWLRKMDTGYTQYVSKTKFVIWVLLTVLNNLTFASVLACLLPSRLVVTSTTVFYGLLNALSYALTSAKVTSIKILAGLLLFSHGNRICVDAVFSKEILYGNLKDSDRLDNQFIEGAMYMFFNSVINAVVVLAAEVICNIKKKHIKRTNVGPVPPVQNDKCFETATGEDAFGIVIRDLVKVYGEDTVVSGINLDIYKDQITMLLGHNGAGKTTTLSIISGVTSITKGKVTINGSDISSRGIRRTVGYCSDVDTLFPNLTSFEHLVFYSKLRGNRIQKDDALDILARLGIEGKADKTPSSLSRGQQRKLSVACAFVGETQTVILDEPSTGLDPASRQDMWRALKSWRQGRTIFMTTHFMDEAENLGDRIAIMEKGRIKCCGTPMFLKNIFGLEHKLTIVKGDNCNGHKVVKHVTSCIREAIFQTSNATDLIFSLPGSSGSEIPRLLSSLEHEMESLHITSYRLAPTSMQDVFTRSQQEDFVNDQGTTELKKDSPALSPKSSPHFMDTVDGVDVSSSADDVNRKDSLVFTARPDTPTCEIQRITGHRLRVQQLCAVMRKRWILLRRAPLHVLLLMLASVSLLTIYISSSHQSPFVQSMYFKAQDYNDIIVVMGKPREPEAQQIYNSVRELLPPDFQVIEPDSSSTYYDYLKDWGRANSVERYRDNLMMGFEIKQPPESSIVYYQSSFVHSEAVAVNLLLNAHVRTYLGANHSIQSGVYSYELFRRDYDLQQWVMVIMHLASFGLQTLIISWLIIERSSGAQQLQAVSGGHYVMFWCANFLFDLALSLVCTALLWGYVVALRASDFLYQHMLLMMLMQLVFSIVVLPFIYHYRFLFSCGKPSTAVFVYIILILAHGLHVNRFKPLEETTVLISPNLHFFVNYISAAKLEGIPLFMLIVRYVTAALLFAVAFWTVVLVGHLAFCHQVESTVPGLCQCDKTDKTEQLDDDVIAEKNRILNTDIQLLSQTDALILKKVGDEAEQESFSAVDYISLGIQKGECFGLLGPNGSGKLALFKLLYNDLSCSSGHVYYSGIKFKISSSKIYQNIGYCPQQDGFHGDLTGRESLQLYGRLKGIPKENLQEVIDGLLKQVMLEAHADKLAKYYSVVDKRKLSIAIALIGNPQFLLLDDPTSGMDMKEKRMVWSLLQDRRAQGCTIVLSSQCMEECEALCTRLTIIAQGKLLCLGTPQHLKTKYAQGLTIIVHLKPQPGHTMEEVIKYLKEFFDQIEIFNQLDTYLHLQVPAEMFPLSVLFDKMETAKKDLDLEHYTIQQASLEQIFLILLNKTKTPNTTELAESKLSDNDKHSTVL